MFQSSPNSLAGCDVIGDSTVHITDRVSILTQLVSWVRRELLASCQHSVHVSILTQLVSWVRHDAFAMFQSSPNSLAGCDSTRRRLVSILTQLVSWVRHATYAADDRDADSRFQSSPNSLAGCDRAAGHRRSRDVSVSILTQLVSWVRHDDASRRCDRRQSFNPHPTR